MIFVNGIHKNIQTRDYCPGQIFDWHIASISHYSLVADLLRECYYCNKSSNSGEDLLDYNTRRHPLYNMLWWVVSKVKSFKCNKIHTFQCILKKSWNIQNMNIYIWSNKILKTFIYVFKCRKLFCTSGQNLVILITRTSLWLTDTRAHRQTHTCRQWQYLKAKTNLGK